MEIRRVAHSESSAQDLWSFMRRVDQDFDPPLAERVDLVDYSRRLLARAEVLVALDVGRVPVGFAACYCNDFTTKVGDLSYLAVVPEARNQGVAVALVETCLDTAARSGMTSVRTRTPARNQRLVEFYSAHGFELTGFGAPLRSDGSESALFEAQVSHLA